MASFNKVYPSPWYNDFMENAPKIRQERFEDETLDFVPTKNGHVDFLLQNQTQMNAFNKETIAEYRDPLEKTKKYLRIALAGLGLVMVGKVTHDFGSEYVEEKVTQEYITKSGLIEKAEKAGFDLKIDVSNGDGPYILHIGYTHSYSGDTPSTQVLNSHNHDLMVQGNLAAEKLLHLLKEDDDGQAAVFTEGFDENSTDYLDFLQEERDKINSVSADADNVDDLINIINQLPAKELLPGAARTAFEYLIVKKLFEISNNDIQMSKEKLTTLLNACEAMLGSFNPNTIDERMIKEGASIKALVDGEYKIAPIESSALLNEMRIVEDELRVLADEIAKLAPQVKSSKDAKIKYEEVVLQYTLLKMTTQNSLIVDSRENYAIKVIQEVVKQGGVESGVVPLLYGASHDFSNNIKYANKNGEQGKIGLVTLLPKVFTEAGGYRQ